MVYFNCQTRMASHGNNLPNNKLCTPTPPPSWLQIPSPPLPPFRPSPASELFPTSDSTYDQYLRLPELRSLWDSTTDFPGWEAESLVKPALHALEITFRFISIVFSDPRPYSNHREWSRRLESLAAKQVEIIAHICQDDAEDGEIDGVMAPIVDLSLSHGVLPRSGGSLAEVWRISTDESTTATVVSRASEASLLPRLAAWGKSERTATKIQYAIECAMRNCPYTLGLGEPNLDGKPSLDYDAVCKPSELHSLKKSPATASSQVGLLDNRESQTIYNIHQILECWIHASKVLVARIENRIDRSEFDRASSDCWLLEEIWNLLEEIERLHLLMDPDDFLRVKSQLRLGSISGSETRAFCFRSKGLTEITNKTKELRHKVPEILGVEVDPMGGPIIQEAAMRLYKKEEMINDQGGGFEKIHLLQALQAVEAALKRFFYGYKQLLVVAMGSLEANGNRRVAAAAATAESAAVDSLAQIFLEPTYYPSLDGAKTFLGGYWEQRDRSGAPNPNPRR